MLVTGEMEMKRAQMLLVRNQHCGGDNGPADNDHK